MADLAYHKRAKFDYEILHTYEAGIVLSGHEVKAIRSGKMKLDGAHVIIRGGEAFLVGAQIAPYQSNNTEKTYEPDRVRKLLLSKKEIAELFAESEKRGLTIVPISVYNKGRNLKVKTAVVRGKKQFDKRERIKERETDRTIERTLKNRKHT
jgi:SsrA-binding protein